MYILKQLKGPTLLHQCGMISTFAYAGLMLPAVISTLLTRPMFHLSNGTAPRMIRRKDIPETAR
jgi:hypothetical protein